VNREFQQKPQKKTLNIVILDIKVGGEEIKEIGKLNPANQVRGEKTMGRKNLRVKRSVSLAGWRGIERARKESS